MTAILVHPDEQLSGDTQQTDDCPMERFEAATREGLESVERGLAAQAIAAAVESDSKPVAIHHRGEVIWARPLNTRRLVQAMAPHLCFN